MVLITEVTAIGILLLKAAEFSSQIRDGWYKGSAELDEFPTKVAILSRKHAQWTSLLEKFGEMDDEHLRHFVNVADQILDKEQKYVRKMERSCVLRSTRRAFPGQLTHILSQLEMSVDAGCKLLESKVDRHALLERHLEQTPYPLPFGPDSKYVPLLSSITEVQNALEDANGRRVVILHGIPGIGKSSLAKYLALHYQNTPKQHMVASSSTTQKWFPSGVFYLLCGQNAKVSELQMDLLESLRGVGGSSAAQSIGSTSAPNQEGEFVHVPHRAVIGKLRVRLAKQKILIILDDVWERDVVENLLLPSEGVKYLLTSQNRSIWSDATKVELKNPDIAQARQIMVNHTEGLPTNGEFPNDIKSLTDEIIEELDYHPLSLANIGATIDSDRATDAEGWKVVKRSLRDLLDENDLDYSPLLYQRSYLLTVDASMMLMVNSLPPGPQHLLFLIGLLHPLHQGDCPIPQVLVKFFLKFFQPTERRWRYQNCIKYLKDRSLVELRPSRAEGIVSDEVNTIGFDLATHRLRTYYIRKKHIADIKSIATEILSGPSETNDHGGQLIWSDTTEETRALPAIMGAMYFDEPFKDLVVPELESQSTIFNSGLVPRSMSYEVDARDLVDRAQLLKFDINALVWLLNPDGEGGWKRQAHDYATKIVIRLAVRKELDDNSMASLIQLPQTTTAACKTLRFLMEYFLRDAFAHAYLDQKRTFSSGHGKTLDSLLCLLHDNAASISRRAATICPLSIALHYEIEDTFLRRVAKKCVEFLAKYSCPTLQIVAATEFWRFYNGLPRADILVGEFPEVLDRLLILTVEGKDSDLQCKAAEALYNLCQNSNYVTRTMAIPGALNILFKKFLSSGKRERGKEQRMNYCQDPGYYAGKVLRRFSNHPGNRVRFTTIDDSLQGLIEMLNSNPKSQSSHMYSAMAADILGNLALTNEVQKVILHTAPQIREGLVRLLQVLMSSLDPKRAPHPKMIILSFSVSRVITIMDPLQAKASITTTPRPHPGVCFEVYMGRVGGYMQMGMYSNALQTFNMLADEFPSKEDHDGYSLSWRSWFVWNNTRGGIFDFSTLYGTPDFRPLRLFLKAMTKDYTGAMLDANKAVEKYRHAKKNWLLLDIFWMSLGERGVLKRLSRINLREALFDLNEALVEWDEFFRYFYHDKRCIAWGEWGRNPHKLWYGCLKHRGLVKSMLGDEVGARADAESAVQLKLDGLIYEDTNDVLGPRRLLDLPVEYLGFIL